MPHLDAPEYQGPGASQMHDAAIAAGLVAAPVQRIPDDVLHFLAQQQRDSSIAEEKQLDDDNEDEDDKLLMQRLRQQRLQSLRRPPQPSVTVNALRAITETEFQHEVLTSSNHHPTLLLVLLSPPSARCAVISSLLSSLSSSQPGVRLLSLVATGDNIARFPLSACPTVMGYTKGRKVGQWGWDDWTRGRDRGAGRAGKFKAAAALTVQDLEQELRRAGILQQSDEQGTEQEADADDGSDTGSDS